MELVGKPIVVLHERDNPSTAYFIEPWSAVDGRRPACFDFDQCPSVEAVDGAFVVIVRYVASLWMRVLEEARHRLAGLAYFMDDDLLDRSAWGGLPLRYRWKLWRYALCRRNWLQRMGAELWVPNEYLRSRYSSNWAGRVRLIPMGLPLADKAVQAAASDTPIFYYHGSASHVAESRWLRPVVEEVLARRSNCRFEIIAAGASARAWSRYDRVDVIAPMPWPEFLRFCRARRRAVGLAPVLDGPFNRARSPVKRIDIDRAGGVGIFSAGTLFDDYVTSGVDGLLLPNEPRAWIDAICWLLADATRRRDLAAAAAARIRREFGKGRTE